MNVKNSQRDWLERKSVRIWKRDAQESANFLGTGCLISRRHILTAAHVVSEVRDPLVVTGRAWGGERTIREEPIYPPHSDARALNRDIAILPLSEAATTEESPIPLADVNFLVETEGQEITIGGFARPFREGLKVLVLGTENYDDSTDSIVLSGPVEDGMSGGPAIKDRQLVGVVYATSDTNHKTYIIPLSAIRSFIQDHTAEMSTSNRPANSLTESALKKWARYVNRDHQIIDLARFLYGQSALASPTDSAPLIALLPCMEEDQHLNLLQRFKDGETGFDPESSYASLLTGIEGHEVIWASGVPPLGEPKNLERALFYLKEQLRSSLGVATTEPVDIRAALNHRRDPQGVFSTIRSKSGTLGPNQKQLVEDWIAFWEEVAGGLATGSALNNPVIIILSVVRPSEEAFLAAKPPSWLSRLIPSRKPGQSLQGWIEEWDNQQGQTVRFDSFQTLDVIRQEHVTSWLKVLQKRLEPKESFEAALTDVPSVIRSDGVRMSDFVSRCLAQLKLSA